MKKETSTAVLWLVVLAGVVFFGAQSIALLIAAVFAAGIIGIFKMLKITQLSKLFPLNLFTIFLALMFLGFGLMGAPDTDGIGLPSIPTGLSTGVTGVGDVVIHPNYGKNGTDWAESTGAFYLLDANRYNTYYDVLQVYIDEGAAGLIGPDGNTAQSASVSSGDVTFSDYEATSGETIAVAYIYDSTPAAAEYPAMLWKDITIVEVDDDDSDNNHKLSGSVVNLWRLGALDSYNWAGTDVTGYLYKASNETTESNKQVEFYVRPNTEGDEVRNVFYYVETDSTFDANIDFIEIAGTTYQFGSWIDIADASSVWTESKESKQTAANYLYAIGSVPSQRYVSSIAGTPDDKGQVLITLQYDVPSLSNATQTMYVYAVPEGTGGSDMHYSAAANPVFTMNVTSIQVTTAWQT